MTFEQLDIQQRDSEKKRRKLEQEKNEQFWLEKQVLRETSDLLHDLALKISQEFGIDISEVKELIRGDTSEDLDGLKKRIHSPKNINLSHFQNALSEARSMIEDLSKKRREALKKSLEKQDYFPEKHEYLTTSKIFSQELRERALNPQSIGDHIMGLGLGLIDSTEAVILFTYGLGKGILITPYHLYLLVTGKAKYDGFSKI